MLLQRGVRQREVRNRPGILSLGFVEPTLVHFHLLQPSKAHAVLLSPPEAIRGSHHHSLPLTAADGALVARGMQSGRAVVTVQCCGEWWAPFCRAASAAPGAPLVHDAQQPICEFSGDAAG